jgi:hypothetical protein
MRGEAAGRSLIRGERVRPFDRAMFTSKWDRRGSVDPATGEQVEPSA